MFLFQLMKEGFRLLKNLPPGGSNHSQWSLKPLITTTTIGLRESLHKTQMELLKTHWFNFPISFSCSNLMLQDISWNQHLLWLCKQKAAHTTDPSPPLPFSILKCPSRRSGDPPKQWSCITWGTGGNMGKERETSILQGVLCSCNYWIQQWVPFCPKYRQNQDCKIFLFSLMWINYYKQWISSMSL